MSDLFGLCVYGMEVAMQHGVITRINDEVFHLIAYLWLSNGWTIMLSYPVWVSLTSGKICSYRPELGGTAKDTLPKELLDRLRKGRGARNESNNMHLFLVAKQDYDRLRGLVSEMDKAVAEAEAKGGGSRAVVVSRKGVKLTVGKTLRGG